MKRERAEEIALKHGLVAFQPGPPRASKSTVDAIMEAAAEEREACAALCDAKADLVEQRRADDIVARERGKKGELSARRHSQAVGLFNACAVQCAAAIRSLDEPPPAPKA